MTLTLAQISARLDTICEMIDLRDKTFGQTRDMIRDVKANLRDLHFAVQDQIAEDDEFEREFSRGFEEAKEASLQRHFEEASHRGHFYEVPETTADDLSAAGDLANDQAAYEAAETGQYWGVV